MMEELSLEMAEYHFDGKISSEQVKKLSKALASIDGIESAEFHDDSVSVRYYPLVLSTEIIRGELIRLGVVLEEKKKRRNPLNRFVNKLAESNTKSFGSETLDCCKLNSKQPFKS